MNPPGGYTSGKVYMTIKSKESGVSLYLEQNGKQIPATLNKEFSVDNGQEFMLTAVPVKNSFTTSFSIKYRTDGAKDPEAEIFKKLEEHRLALLGVKSKVALYAGIGAGAFVIILILVGFICYKRK